jgi:transcriptional regulator GlxA family with amidase domain
MSVRWIVLVLNLIAAVAFLCLALVFASAHRAHAYSTYRYFVINNAVIEGQKSSDGKPVDIQGRMEAIGTVDVYYTFLGVLAAAACTANGFVFFLRCARPSDCPAIEN